MDVNPGIPQTKLFQVKTRTFSEPLVLKFEILITLPATYTTPKAIYYAWREILKSSTAHRVGYPGE